MVSGPGVVNPHLALDAEELAFVQRGQHIVDLLFEVGQHHPLRRRLNNVARLRNDLFLTDHLVSGEEFLSIPFLVPVTTKPHFRHGRRVKIQRNGVKTIAISSNDH